jgi:hypothetical protein
MKEFKQLISEKTGKLSIGDFVEISLENHSWGKGELLNIFYSKEEKIPCEVFSSSLCGLVLIGNKMCLFPIGLIHKIEPTVEKRNNNY